MRRCLLCRINLLLRHFKKIQHQIVNTLSYKTQSIRKEDVTREWYIVDAAGLNVGRLCTQIATTLRGKHKPSYTPHVDNGDYIISVYPNMPSGTSMMRVKPAALRRSVMRRERTPRAHINATGRAVSPPVLASKTASKSDRRISIGTACSPIPVLAHSSGLRISTRTISPRLSSCGAS